MIRRLIWNNLITDIHNNKIRIIYWMMIHWILMSWVLLRWMMRNGMSMMIYAKYQYWRIEWKPHRHLLGNHRITMLKPINKNNGRVVNRIINRGIMVIMQNIIIKNVNRISTLLRISYLKHYDPIIRYLDHWHLLLDNKLIAMTFWMMLGWFQISWCRIHSVSKR